MIFFFVIMGIGALLGATAGYFLLRRWGRGPAITGVVIGIMAGALLFPFPIHGGATFLLISVEVQQIAPVLGFRFAPLWAPLRLIHCSAMTLPTRAWPLLNFDANQDIPWSRAVGRD